PPRHVGDVDEAEGISADCGGIIVSTVVVIWLLMAIPVGADGVSLSDYKSPAPEDSAYGAISRSIAPAFAPAGFDSWSLAAASDGVCGQGSTDFHVVADLRSRRRHRRRTRRTGIEPLKREGARRLRHSLRRKYERCSVGVYALPARYTPCVATLAAQKREIGWRWTLFGFAVQLFTAWALAVVAFQLLRLL
ncbi:ferrous iron transporter B, partial [Bacteroides fragilis]|nr:ferrous iron transporter B [Bacteroides fragilis]